MRERFWALSSGSPPPPPSPKARVQPAVGPELDLAALVVEPRVWHANHGSVAVRVRTVGVAGLAPVLGDIDVAPLVGVVDVESARLGVVRGERHRQQPALAARAHQTGDVEEGLVQRGAALDDHDAAASLHHEARLSPRGAVRYVGSNEASKPQQAHQAASRSFALQAVGQSHRAVCWWRRGRRTLPRLRTSSRGEQPRTAPRRFRTGGDLTPPEYGNRSGVRQASAPGSASLWRSGCARAWWPLRFGSERSLVPIQSAR